MEDLRGRGWYRSRVRAPSGVGLDFTTTSSESEGKFMRRPITIIRLTDV